MNCFTKIIVDTSSLFKNDILVVKSSVSFTIQDCKNINLDIFLTPTCCIRKPCYNVSCIVRNDGDRVLENASLILKLTPCDAINCCCNIKRYNLENLSSGYSEIINLKLPYNPCLKSRLCVLVVANNKILKEECRII